MSKIVKNKGRTRPWGTAPLTGVCGNGRASWRVDSTANVLSGTLSCLGVFFVLFLLFFSRIVLVFVLSLSLFWGHFLVFSCYPLVVSTWFLFCLLAMELVYLQRTYRLLFHPI